MKCLSLFLLYLIVFGNFISIQNRKSSRRDPSVEDIMGFLNKKVNNKIEVKKIPKGIIWQGWVKYIHFHGDSKSHPNSFFQNKKYYRQRILKTELKRKDKKGQYLHIPSSKEFWATLRKDEMIFTSSRRDLISNNHDSLFIDSILPLGQNKFKSSIQDLGDFSEGSCIQIFTNVPRNFDEHFNAGKDSGEKISWIICMNDKKARDILLNNMISLKVAKHGEEEKKKILPSTKPLTLAKVLEPKKKEGQIEMAPGAKLVDGYWILLQDWSQCTLKCGGGKSVQHWMCVPPKQGGKPCQGKAIRERPCNTHPCPNTAFFGGSNSSVEVMNETTKPIVKVIPFSTRPQVNQKCVLKESDVFYLWQPTLTSKAMTKRPARVIMNTRTISLFNDENHSNSVFTFDLQKTNIYHDNKDSCCFILSSETRQFTICGGFGTTCAHFYDEWNNDFNMFKLKCYQAQKEMNSKEKAANKALDDASKQATSAMAEEKADLIKKHMQEKENVSLDKQIVTTESLALKALKKELNIEKLLQQEFRLKAELEAKHLLDLKKREKKKQDTLNKLLKDKEQEMVKIREKKLAEMQLKKIKDDAKKDIEKKREQLRKKILEMQKKLNRKKRLIERDIYTIRNQMAKNLMDANRNGDMMKCKNALGYEDKMNFYCNTNIVDDYRKNIECKSELNFCYICCESEFGSMVMDKRDQCYTMCDELMNKLLDRGDFRWGGK